MPQTFNKRTTLGIGLTSQCKDIHIICTIKHKYKLYVLNKHYLTIRGFDTLLYMKKKGYWFSTMAITLSVVTFIYVLVDVKPFTVENTEFLGWSVAALSFIAAVLIWWNVANYTIFKRTMQEEMKRIAQKEIESKSRNLKGLIIYVRHLDYYNRNIDEKAIDGFIMALSEIIQSKEKDGMGDIIYCLRKIADRYNDLPCSIYRGKKRQYLDTLSKIEGQDIELVRGMIFNAKELDY